LDHGFFNFGGCAIMFGVGCLDVSAFDNSGHASPPFRRFGQNCNRIF
jgi:hypothetical protein